MFQLLILENRRRDFSLKIALFIVLLTAIAASIYPATTTRAANTCDFQNGLRDLSQKKDSYINDNSLDNLLSELDTRKAILNQILDCAVGDAANLQSSVKSLSINDPDIQNIQNRLVSKFDDAINYYRFQKILVGDLGIEGSKKFSIDLKEWRNSNYEALFELGTNFIIFSKNQELMRIAGDRFNQIKRTLQALGLTDNETIRTLLQNAEDNFGKANDNNNRAREIFRLLSWPNDSLDRITSSLEYLKETYQNFFDIRTEAQKIISG